MDDLSEIIEDLDSTIYSIWTYYIKKDFLKRIFIYNEHELIACFYYHLRRRIEDMNYNNIRVFLEFPYEKNPRKRYDLIVMTNKENLPWEKHPFMRHQEGEILFAIEFKFIQNISYWENIHKDIEKLFKLKEVHKEIQKLYFISIGKFDIESITNRIKTNNPRNFKKSFFI